VERCGGSGARDRGEKKGALRGRDGIDEFEKKRYRRGKQREGGGKAGRRARGVTSRAAAGRGETDIKR